jgi:hypothetical protein
MDQLRALREAKYARKNEQPAPDAAIADEPAKGAPKKKKRKPARGGADARRDNPR